jgi:hypothetical protein
MTVNAKQLAQAVLGTTAALLYTAPSVSEGLLKDVVVANSSDVPASVSLYIVKAGDTPGIGSVMLPGVSIAPGGIASWFGSQVLPPGAGLYAKATLPNCLTLTASGAEIT